MIEYGQRVYYYNRVAHKIESGLYRDMSADDYLPDYVEDYCLVRNGNHTSMPLKVEVFVNKDVLIKDVQEFIDKVQNNLNEFILKNED